jgi:hypothetical protein
MKQRPTLCGWEGIRPDDPERIIPCLKPAVGYVESTEGRRIFCCDEHRSQLATPPGAAEFIRSIRVDDCEPPAAHHGASAQGRHNLTVVGHMEFPE